MTQSERNQNVGARLAVTAAAMPDALAVVEPAGRRSGGRQHYRRVTFRELDEDSDRLASGLLEMGVRPGMRLVLMVRPGVDFTALVFAMLKAGIVIVLIDPGMGRSRMIRCLQEVQPDGFVAIPLAQAVRSVLRARFPAARFQVTVGRRWFWGGTTLDELRRRPPAGPSVSWPPTSLDDPAAIIFTTGSTGPPKGVQFCHGNFSRQADEIRDFYQIQAGEVDLPCFPLFALFNTVMGVTSVIPEMDPTRPASVDPEKIVAAVRDWQVTQAFASPALWNVVGRYCEKEQVRLPTLRRVLSAGAPVPIHVLERMKRVIDPAGDVHTPYGATEALPIASISASDVLQDTAAASRTGAGTCVGGRFPCIRWKIISITEDPLDSLDQAEELPQGEVGELVVQGPVVTRKYVTQVAANREHKMADGGDVWHRMGDVGYLDSSDRFWFCGRKSHRVLTASGPMYTVPCEAVFNVHPRVYRSALVGVGERGRQRPVVVVETWPDARPRSRADRNELVTQLKTLAASQPLTERIGDFLLHRSLPVDIRHNAKIFREKLAVWAARRLRVAVDGPAGD